MDIVDVVEIEPEAFTPIWLTQQSLKELKAFSMLKKLVPDLLHNVLQKPHVFVIRHPRQIDMDFVLGTIIKEKDKANQIYLNHTLTLSKPTGWPFAIVVFLDSSGKHGDCHLSRNDLRLLEWHKEQLAKLEDVVYVIKNTRFSVNYDTDDLDVLSKEIQTTIQGNIMTNITYANVFLHEDKQIPVRIGHQLHNSTINCFGKIIHLVKDEISKLRNEHFLLQKNRERFVCSVAKTFSKNTFSEGKMSAKQPNNLFWLNNHVIENCNESLKSFHLNSLLDIIETFERVIAEKFQKVFLKYTEENVKHTVDHRFRIKHVKREKRSMKCHIQMETFTEKGNGSKRIKSRLFTHSTRYTDTYVKGHLILMSKELITQFIETVTDILKTLETCCSVLQEECTSALDGNVVHKWKIVSERHKKVSGFGYINGIFGIYLKENNENDRKMVQDYIENHFDTAKFKFKIEYRRRKVTLFSKIEQGSRINKTKESRQGQKGYGTLGMFLHDNNGTYFFTTCAHVIDEDAMAYFPENNSKLGVSVLTCHPNSDISRPNEKWIDFSLVKVLPDNEITCIFGLKTSTGSFIEGDIFKGDVSEILNKRVYKWGATKPYLQTGKCKGFENNERFILLEIDTENFAKPGDSGCIICVGDDVERGIAAFVLVGVCTDSDFGNKPTYAVYNVSDALEKIAEIGKEVTPCLSPRTKTIRIESGPQ